MAPPNEDLSLHRQELSEEEAAVLENARALRRAAHDGRARAPLRGKNLALLCVDCTSDDARRFVHAATGLGARVADIRPNLALSAPEELAQTARILGRLYDGVECQDLPPVFVAQTTAHAGVPVFTGLASSTHPTARLTALLEGGATSPENRLFVLQAALVTALG